jgi:hypothetical protein
MDVGKTSPGSARSATRTGHSPRAHSWRAAYAWRHGPGRFQRKVEFKNEPRSRPGVHDRGDFQTDSQRCARDFEDQRRGQHADRATQWNWQVAVSRASYTSLFSLEKMGHAVCKFREAHRGWSPGRWCRSASGFALRVFIFIIAPPGFRFDCDRTCEPAPSQVFRW